MKQSMTLALQSKVALVTGASRGLGRAIALELAGMGCDLMLAARDAAALEQVAVTARGEGRKATIHAADLAAPAAAAGLAAAVESAFGKLDIFVGSAGAVGRGDFLRQSDAEWQAGFELKFFAHVRLARLLWPMLKGAGGSVVMIAGIGARAPVGDYAIGASVIGAQLAFMKALADIGKRDGVQVNAVNPGSVATDRLQRRMKIIEERTGFGSEAAREHHRKELDITRFGEPGDIAGLVGFIVSPRGRWLHGASIDMDGGQIVPLRMSRYD
jgi:NAD(P)-dependent dehydrogenase (short-subunit alcohol dehydrogenase family)